MKTKLHIYMIPNVESDTYPRPGSDYAAVVYSYKKGEEIDLGTFKLFPSMDDPEMHFLAESSPFKPWDKFDMKKGNKSFKANLSPIEIPLFSSKDDKVKALI
tara:strand:+ start:367 stop:672 length:306 start_codon:yes stop_codon:yes gene_type:complete